MATNWKLIRNEYETLGTDVKELATSHHTSEALIQTAITSEGWKPYVVGDDTDTEDIAARLRAMDARHQTTLVPKFIALQAKMLEKCDMLLDAVNDLDDAGNLRVVSEVIEKHRPAIMGNKDGDTADKSITVRILSKVGEGADVAVNAVEITTSAGMTNGVGQSQGVPRGTPYN
jgi:hypothetical protein